MDKINSAHLNAIFVSGTDTGVGKTVVTAGLLRAFHKKELAAQAIKPVQTGVSGRLQGDELIYAAAVSGLNIPPGVTLRRYRLAASPHLAARQEGARLTAGELALEIGAQWRKSHADIFIIEGAGGLAVPLNAHEDMADLAGLLDIPVLLVCPNKLGAINQAMLSMEAVCSRGLKLAGVILNECLPGADDADCRAILEDNAETVGAHLSSACPGARLVRLPFLERFSAKEWDALAAMLEPVAKINNRTPAHSNLKERDHALLWHPYASVLRKPALDVATRTKGNRIVLEDGTELIDGMSSWWAACHGYNNPRLLSALRAQACRMPHVMFGGLTHEPAVALGESLGQVLPHGLERIFFADSGSVAVEVALKMAIQYHAARNDWRRKRFLAPVGAYHGDTMGAMSVSNNGMHEFYKNYLPGQFFMERPSCRFDAPYDAHSLDRAREIFEMNGEGIAAVILEPVVQGAGGMWFYHPEYLDGMRRLCDQYGALLIFDEIASGFGRTGKYFATEWANSTPDIMCCGKALTGGMMTLAATACTRRVAEGICASGEPFMHGPTFMANPLACAVALENLNIMAENKWRKQVADIRAGLSSGLATAADLPSVADVRVLGAIGVLEMKKEINAEALQHFFVGRGVWIRPFGKLIYLMPPYPTPEEDLNRLCAAAREAAELICMKKL